MESTSQVVSQGCQQVVSQPHIAIAPTKAPQPPTPFKSLPIIQVGDRCRYYPNKGAMAVTCRGKELEVLNTRVNEQGEQRVRSKSIRVLYELLGAVA